MQRNLAQPDATQYNTTEHENGILQLRQINKYNTTHHNIPQYIKTHYSTYK